MDEYSNNDILRPHKRHTRIFDSVVLVRIWMPQLQQEAFKKKNMNLDVCKITDFIVVLYSHKKFENVMSGFAISSLCRRLFSHVLFFVCFLLYAFMALLFLSLPLQVLWTLPLRFLSFQIILVSFNATIATFRVMNKIKINF